jgi:excisionase family DNA binding protein
MSETVERLLTARDLGEFLDVSPETVLRWTRRGELPAIKLPGGAIRYRADDLDDWLTKHATAAPGREARTVPTGAAAETLPSSARTVPLLSAAQDEEDPNAR